MLFSLWFFLFVVVKKALSYLAFIVNYYVNCKDIHPAFSTIKSIARTEVNIFDNCGSVVARFNYTTIIRGSIAWVICH
jgi:hypothetical protein